MSGKNSRLVRETSHHKPRTMLHFVPGPDNTAENVSQASTNGTECDGTKELRMPESV